jgi:hypothetical protein
VWGLIRCAPVAVSLLAACDPTRLNEGTAEELLVAHLASTSKAQVVETSLGQAVPLGQSSAHTEAWWAEFESLTNGQDRTRMLHVDAAGSAEPPVVAGLREARLVIVHGQVRDPIRTNIWWTLVTPVSEVRAAARRSGSEYRLELCTLSEGLEGVTEIHQDEPDRARVDYATVVAVASTPYAEPLAGVLEASSCQATGARARTLNFVREGEAWRIDLPQPPPQKKKR